MIKNQGFVAIATVLVITSVVLAISISVTLLSIGEAQSGLALFYGEDNLTFAEGCMEDALQKANTNPGYTGGNITRPEGTCTVTVSKVGTTWTITTSSNTAVYRRSIQVVIVRSGSAITLTSWKEI